MATIAVLSTSIRADTSQFDKKMRGASKTIKKLGKNITGSAKMMTGYGVAIAAVAAGAMVLFIKNSMTAIDVTAKLADSIGVTTEFVQSMGLAAEITGVDIGTINKSLEKMTKGLGEAKQGLGTAKDGLKALNLNIDELLKLKPEEQFKLIAEGISKLGTAAERAAVASQFFGRSGIKLLTLFKEGASGISAFEEEARQLGITFDKIDAAKVEEANDSFTRLSKLIEGIFLQISIKLSPFLTVINSKLLEIATSGGTVGDKIKSSFQSGITSIARMADDMGLLVGVVLQAAGAFQLLRSGFLATQSSKLLFGERAEKLSGEAAAARLSANKLFTRAERLQASGEGGEFSQRAQKFIEEVQAAGEKPGADKGKEQVDQQKITNDLLRKMAVTRESQLDEFFITV